MPPSIEAIIQGVVDTIQPVLGDAQVDSLQNGKSTWANAPLQSQSYWIVDHEVTSGKRVGVGGISSGTVNRIRTFKIDAWMPWSVQLETAELFRDLVNDVEWQITTHRGLGVCAKMVGLPEVALVKVEPYTSYHQGDQPTMCHHARITFDAVTYRPVLVS